MCDVISYKVNIFPVAQKEEEFVDDVSSQENRSQLFQKSA